MDKMTLARSVYESLVYSLEEKDWKFQRFDNDLVIRSGIKGEDLPIEFIVLVKAENMVVQFISKLPFSIPEDKRVEAAICVSVANYGLVDGSFDYDINDGEIRYRLTASYRGTNDGCLDPDLFEYMIMCASSTVDDYNDRFFMLAKGMIDVDKFISMETN